MGRTFGSKLLHRRPEGPEPLPAAAVPLRNAHAVLRNLSQRRMETAEIGTGVRGVVTVAASTATAANYLPREPRAFSPVHPAVTIAIRDALGPDAVRMVAEGAVDLSIFAEPTLARTRSTLPYRTEKLVAVLPFDFVLGRPGGSLSTIIERAAEEAGRAVRSRVRVSGSETIARMVEAGHGVSILPASLARPVQVGGRLTRPPRGAWAVRHLHLCLPPHGTMTKPARLLADHLAAAHRDASS